MKCLFQWKNEECSPVSMSERCRSIIECIEASSIDYDEVTLIFAILTQISKALSENILGPFILFASYLGFIFLKRYQSK